jgi:hypothetical protein
MTGWKEIIYIGLILVGVILLGLVLGLERHIIAEAFESQEQSKEETQEGFFNEPITVDSDVNVQGATNVNNLNVNNLLKAGNNIYSQQWPSGWARKGIHAWDVYANGTVGAGRNGVVRSSLRSDGQICLGGTCMNETELRKLKQMASGNIQANQISMGTRWKIQPEGDYLVFRDTKASRDSRFAMYPNHYGDLKKVLNDNDRVTIRNDSRGVSRRLQRGNGDVARFQNMNRASWESMVLEKL